MLVIHTGETGGSLFVWCEESTDDAEGISPRARKKARPLPHPFAAGSARLVDVLQSASLGLTTPVDSECRMTAWLPTRGSIPAPSTALISEQRATKARLRIAPWSVAAYRLSNEEAVRLLSVSSDKRTLAPGLIVGVDTAYWAETLQFAASLVARQRFLPDLALRNDDAYRAVWSPVLTGDDAEQFSELASRMPAAARALTEAAETESPSRRSTEVLENVVGALTDHLVRVGAHDRRSSHKPGRRAGISFDSPHDSWLDALTTEDGTVRGHQSELAQLAAQVRDWRRPLEALLTFPFRLCFRLEEPAGGEGHDAERDSGPDDTWLVRYLLQSRDDPSLLIPAEDAWRNGSDNATSSVQMDSSVRAFLLSSLGQASGICPAISAGLEAGDLQGYRLDTLEAHECLVSHSLALRQADFGVLLPAWWTRGGTRVRPRANANVKSPPMEGMGGMGLDTVLRFDWELSLGDQKLTLDELDTLARLKMPLVRVRGQWVEVNPDEIQQAIDFWKNWSGEASVREVIRTQLGAGNIPEWVELDSVRSSGWVGDLLEQLEGHADFEELASPGGFSGTLRPYQVRGYSWLSFLRKWGLGACLADDMGLGKTVQTLALIQRDWQTRNNRPVLLVCPTTVMNNWHKEASRFTPELPVMVHHGPDRSRGGVFRNQAERHAIVISSYGLLHRDIDLFREVKWAGIVLDEAQNVKNHQTRQSMAARSIRADYRIALTGTPVENSVGDLWSIMEFLNPGLLGTQSEFRRNFLLPIQSEHDPLAAQRLKRITGPFVLRRLKTDSSIISDLPEKWESRVYCSLTTEQASLYAAVVRETEEALEEAEGIERRGLVLAALSKLKQVCNHPAQFLDDRSSIADRSGKLERLAEILEETLSTGDRVLIFSQFAQMGRIIQRHVQETFGAEALFLHGGISKSRRDRMVERFQEERDGPRVFVLSLKAGGTGLNLTRANHVIHYDRWWNPAVENQATDRAFRIGQTRNVQVHKFICTGTLEESIDEMIERKVEVAERVVGAGENWLTELSNEDLIEVLALSADAVGV